MKTYVWQILHTNIIIFHGTGYSFICLESSSCRLSIVDIVGAFSSLLNKTCILFFWTCNELDAYSLQILSISVLFSGEVGNMCTYGLTHIQYIITSISSWEVSWDVTGWHLSCQSRLDQIPLLWFIYGSCHSVLLPGGFPFLKRLINLV